MVKSKKSTKKQRSDYENPALEKTQNLKTRQEEIDDVKSYWNQLNAQEKDFMNRFMEEYNNANFDHGGPILHKSKRLKKACYDKNNARNRCIQTQENAKGLIQNVEKLTDFEQLDITEFPERAKQQRKKRRKR
jgi:hypothetical protein